MTRSFRPWASSHGESRSTIRLTAGPRSPRTGPASTLHSRTRPARFVGGGALRLGELEGPHSRRVFSAKRACPDAGRGSRCVSSQPSPNINQRSNSRTDSCCRSRWNREEADRESERRSRTRVTIYSHHCPFGIFLSYRAILEMRHGRAVNQRSGSQRGSQATCGVFFPFTFPCENSGKEDVRQTQDTRTSDPADFPITSCTMNTNACPSFLPSLNTSASWPSVTLPANSAITSRRGERRRLRAFHGSLAMWFLLLFLTGGGRTRVRREYVHTRACSGVSEVASTTCRRRNVHCHRVRVSGD